MCYMKIEAVYFSETIVNEVTFQEAILMYTVVSSQVRFKSIAKHTAAACVSHLGGRGESAGCTRVGTESHEQLFFACELGTADEGECSGRWNQLLCYR